MQNHVRNPIIKEKASNDMTPRCCIGFGIYRIPTHHPGGATSLLEARTVPSSEPVNGTDPEQSLARFIFKERYEGLVFMDGGVLAGCVYPDQGAAPCAVNESNSLFLGGR